MTETIKSNIEASPHNFETPLEIVADPALSKNEKVQALDLLEQDARLLASASNEGMGGGEPTNLHEVLDAKATLELSPTDHAYQIVLDDLKLRQAAAPRDGSQAMIDQAMEALQALHHPGFASGSTGAGKSASGSTAEIAAETELEKLDP